MSTINNNYLFFFLFFFFFSYLVSIVRDMARLGRLNENARREGEEGFQRERGEAKATRGSFRAFVPRTSERTERNNSGLKSKGKVEHDRPRSAIFRARLEILPIKISKARAHARTPINSPSETEL